MYWQFDLNGSLVERHTLLPSDFKEMYYTLVINLNFSYLSPFFILNGFENVFFLVPA